MALAPLQGSLTHKACIGATRMTLAWWPTVWFMDAATKACEWNPARPVRVTLVLPFGDLDDADVQGRVSSGLIVSVRLVCRCQEVCPFGADPPVPITDVRRLGGRMAGYRLSCRQHCFKGTYPARVLAVVRARDIPSRSHYGIGTDHVACAPGVRPRPRSRPRGSRTGFRQRTAPAGRVSRPGGMGGAFPMS